jgi:hypothetical protein
MKIDRKREREAKVAEINVEGNRGNRTKKKRQNA